MKCTNCNKNLKLNKFGDNLYECENCGRTYSMFLFKNNNENFQFFIESFGFLNKESQDYLDKLSATRVIDLCKKIVEIFPYNKTITIEDIREIEKNEETIKIMKGGKQI